MREVRWKSYAIGKGGPGYGEGDNGELGEDVHGSSLRSWCSSSWVYGGWRKEEEGGEEVGNGRHIYDADAMIRQNNCSINGNRRRSSYKERACLVLE